MAGSQTAAKRVEPIAAQHTSSELALIYAAERLFAEHGIAGVSLRQINQAANQRNSSAAHYHFGSRDGLALAVLEHRLLDMDQRRRRILDQDDAPRDLKFYVTAMITTLAEELQPRAEGNHYLRFIEQYQRYKDGQEIARKITPAGVEIYARIDASVAHLAPAIRKLRMRYLVDLVHGVLARAEHQLGIGVLDFSEVPGVTSNLIDMVYAAMSAPVSAETLEAVS